MTDADREKLIVLYQAFLRAPEGSEAETAADKALAAEKTRLGFNPNAESAEMERLYDEAAIRNISEDNRRRAATDLIAADRLRDEVAMRAFTALVAANPTGAPIDGDHELRARYAFDFADAFMAEREKRRGGR